MMEEGKSHQEASKAEISHGSKNWNMEPWKMRQKPRQCWVKGWWDSLDVHIPDPLSFNLTSGPWKWTSLDLFTPHPQWATLGMYLFCFHF